MGLARGFDRIEPTITDSRFTDSDVILCIQETCDPHIEGEVSVDRVGNGVLAGFAGDFPVFPPVYGR